jgi:hypothetical protein
VFEYAGFVLCLCYKVMFVMCCDVLCCVVCAVGRVARQPGQVLAAVVRLRDHFSFEKSVIYLVPQVSDANDKKENFFTFFGSVYLSCYRWSDSDDPNRAPMVSA